MLPPTDPPPSPLPIAPPSGTKSNVPNTFVALSCLLHPPLPCTTHDRSGRMFCICMGLFAAFSFRTWGTQCSRRVVAALLGRIILQSVLCSPPRIPHSLLPSSDPSRDSSEERSTGCRLPACSIFPQKEGLPILVLMHAGVVHVHVHGLACGPMSSTLDQVL